MRNVLLTPFSPLEGGGPGGAGGGGGGKGGFGKGGVERDFKRMKHPRKKIFFSRD